MIELGTFLQITSTPVALAALLAAFIGGTYFEGNASNRKTMGAICAALALHILSRVMLHL